MSVPKRVGAPGDVAAIRKRIEEFLNSSTSEGCKIRSYYGVYVFYDYDGEPIYVGQSMESLGQRIGRHLTNQRTDAVAMNVLDPFEVAEIEVYLLCVKPAKAPARGSEAAKKLERDLDALEYTVFQHVLDKSEFGVLNEGNVPIRGLVPLPESHRGSIIPEELYAARKHPDVRIARRAATISRLAQVISERNPSAGLRRTLVTQAQRLQRLAEQRFGDFASEVPEESPED